jgi:hypothetical protein
MRVPPVLQSGAQARDAIAAPGEDQVAQAQQRQQQPGQAPRPTRRRGPAGQLAQARDRAPAVASRAPRQQAEDGDGDERDQE